MSDKKYNSIQYDSLEEKDSSLKEIREALIGWTIVEVGITLGGVYKSGTFKGDHFNTEGGLTLLLAKKNKRRKVILGYTELGEWLENVEEIKE